MYQVAIPDNEVSGIRKYGHGGGNIDEQREQKAIKTMPT